MTQEKINHSFELWIWFTSIRGGWYQPSTLAQAHQDITAGREPKKMKELIKIANMPGNPLVQFFKD